MKFLYVAICFIVGTAVAVLNMNFSKKALKKGGNAVYTVSLVRSVLNIGLMVVVFLIFRNTEYGVAYPLVAAALGLTIPTMIMAFAMTKNQTNSPDENEKTQNGKGVS